MPTSKEAPMIKSARMIKSASMIKGERTIKDEPMTGLGKIRTRYAKQGSMSTEIPLMGKRAASETRGVTRNFGVRPELLGNCPFRDYSSA
jgi:hypothetical protein